MNLFKARVWSAVDIGCLKWSCIFVGMLAGAWWPEFTRRYVAAFAAAAVLLAIKPLLSYFRNSPREPGTT